jgi:uncharacterized membrane protein
MLDRMQASPVRDGITLPSADGGLAANAAELIGGPPGRHAAIGRSWWTPVRLGLAVLLITLFAGWSYKAPCQSATADWGASQYQYRHFCYSDIFPLYGAEGFDQNKAPYRDVTRVDADGTVHYLEYPVGIAVVMQTATWITHALPNGGAVDWFNITALLLALGTVAAFFAFVPLAGRRPYDGLLFAAAPALALHAFTNWDLAAVALTIVGLWAWMRSKPVLAGVLLGLGTTTKLFPAFVLVALAILALRSERAAWRPVLRAWGAAILAVVVTNLPIAAKYHAGWWEFFKLNKDRAADWDTVWFWFLNMSSRSFPSAQLHDLAADTPLLNKVTIVLMVAVVAGLAWLCAAAPQRPRLAQIAFVLVAAFLLLNKVFSPQYTLWLLPLAVLARPRWGLFLVWQLSEVIVWVTRLSHFYEQDHPGKGALLGHFFMAVGFRDLMLLTLIGFVIRDVLRPEHDIVRRSHDGLDPLAGPLDDVDEPATQRRPAHARAVPGSAGGGAGG